MTSREEDRARLLAAYTDDLLADREPIVPAEAATFFTPEELARALSTVRLLKGLLRPSQMNAGVENSLKARLVERMRGARAAEITAANSAITLPVLLAERRRTAGLSVADLAAQAKLHALEIESIEADSLPLNDLSPERLLDMAIALAIPVHELLQAARVSAERWLPRLARSGLEPGLAGFRASTGMAAAAEREAARREAAEILADYLGRLEDVARGRGLV